MNKIKTNLNTKEDKQLKQAVASELLIETPEENLIEGLVYANTERDDRKPGCSPDKKNS